MIHTLRDEEMRELLERQSYGHLGCCTSEKNLYVVPITYVYSKGSIYSFSFEGKKVDILRKNPRVCFQVEELLTPEKWSSVIVWGNFEELPEIERTDGLTLLLERFWKEANQNNPLYFPFRNSAKALEASKNDENVVIYRITIDEMSGRTEQYE